MRLDLSKILSPQSFAVRGLDVIFKSDFDIVIKKKDNKVKAIRTQDASVVAEDERDLASVVNAAITAERMKIYVVPDRYVIDQSIGLQRDNTIIVSDIDRKAEISTSDAFPTGAPMITGVEIEYGGFGVGSVIRGFKLVGDGRARGISFPLYIAVDILISYVDMENVYQGILMEEPIGVVIDNCTISAADYGIMVGGQASGDLIVLNSFVRGGGIRIESEISKLVVRDSGISVASNKSAIEFHNIVSMAIIDDVNMVSEGRQTKGIHVGYAALPARISVISSGFHSLSVGINVESIEAVINLINTAFINVGTPYRLVSGARVNYIGVYGISGWQGVGSYVQP